jgi:hypothetical protein
MLDVTGNNTTAVATAVSRFPVLEQAILTCLSRSQKYLDLTNVWIVFDALPNLLVRAFLLIVLMIILVAVAGIVLEDAVEFVRARHNRVSFAWNCFRATRCSICRSVVVSTVRMRYRPQPRNVNSPSDTQRSDFGPRCPAAVRLRSWVSAFWLSYIVIVALRKDPRSVSCYFWTSWTV